MPSKLLDAQFANGAFPQSWDESSVPDQPVLHANYPEYDWRTEGRVKDYWDRYAPNDGLTATVADTLSDAYEIYEGERTAVSRTFGLQR